MTGGSAAAIVVRSASKRDRGMVQRFTCVPRLGPAHGQEVQRGLRHHAITDANVLAHEGACVLLVLQHEQLLGMVHVERWPVPDEAPGQACWTIVRLAVALEAQGQVVAGAKVSQVLLDAAVDHMMTCSPDQDVVVRAAVHVDNVRSARLFLRRGAHLVGAGADYWQAEMHVAATGR